MCEPVNHRPARPADIDKGRRSFEFVMSGLVEQVADPDHTGSLSGEVYGMGFSSLPLFCRFVRVTAKSALLRAAVAANNAMFLLSQNSWEVEVSRCVVSTKGGGLIKGFVPVGEGPWLRP
jgi:hypothetical protein